MDRAAFQKFCIHRGPPILFLWVDRSGVADDAEHRDVRIAVGVRKAVVEIVAVCKRGMRSFNAANWLRAQGRNAVSLQGGLDQWKALGLPVKK